MSDARSLTSLSDNELLARLAALCRRERETTIEILRHLNEIERRKLHLKLGYSSMFAYCTGHLRYSESAAGRRVQTARCMRRFRPVERMLEQGDVSLSTVSMIASILDETNAEDILSKVRGMPRREIEELVAHYKPPVRLRDRVQPVRVVVPERAPVGDHSRGGSGEMVANALDSLGSGENPSPKGTYPTPEIRAEMKLLIQFVADKAFMAKYNEACAMLSNKMSNPTFEAVFSALLDEFLERHSPRERQARRQRRQESTKTVPPRKSASRASRPAIPARTRDAVFVRDRGRCTYVGSNGKRCGETHHLHVDHITPVARSGTNDARNLRLLCAKHNQLEGARILGDGVMKPFHRDSRRTPGPVAPARASTCNRSDRSSIMMPP